MIAKNTKIFVFAGLIAAMALSFSFVDLVDAVPNKDADERSLKQQYDDISQQYHNTQTELQKLENQNSKNMAQANAESKKAGLRDKMSNLKLEAQKIQQQNIQAHNMPVHIEKRLAEAEALVEANIEDLSGAYVNGKERTLKVIVGTQGAADKVQELVGHINDGKTSLKVRVSSFEFSGCTAQDAECNPVMGRIQIDGSGDSPCRLAVPYTKGTSEGFLTAGHCVDNSGFVY